MRHRDPECCPGVDIFLVNKLFCAFAGVRGANIRKEAVQR